MNWFAKPPWLSPLVCARYGWKNTGVDCLHCVSCGKYISGRIPSTRNPTVCKYGEERQPSVYQYHMRGWNKFVNVEILSLSEQFYRMSWQKYSSFFGLQALTLSRGQSGIFILNSLVLGSINLHYLAFTNFTQFCCLPYPDAINLTVLGTSAGSRYLIKFQSWKILEKMGLRLTD